jgi:hypothetical protein
MNRFTSEELIARFKTKNKTDDEWMELLDDVKEFLKGNVPHNIRRQFEPLGYLEMLYKICDGIDYKNGTGRYAENKK